MGVKKVLKIHLEKQLYTLKMNESGDIKCHINRFKQYVYELLRIDVKMQDEYQVMILLSSLLYGLSMSSLLEGKTTKVLDEMFTLSWKLVMRCN